MLLPFDVSLEMTIKSFLAYFISDKYNHSPTFHVTWQTLKWLTFRNIFSAYFKSWMKISLWAILRGQHSAVLVAGNVVGLPESPRETYVPVWHADTARQTGGTRDTTRGVWCAQVLVVLTCRRLISIEEKFK